MKSDMHRVNHQQKCMSISSVRHMIKRMIQTEQPTQQNMKVGNVKKPDVHRAKNDKGAKPAETDGQIITFS